MSKAAMFNRFCAVVFILAFTILFALNSRKWYAEKFVQVRTNIEGYFANFPHSAIEAGLKDVYSSFMTLTNRKYNNDVVVLNDGRLMFMHDEVNTYLHERASAITSLSEYLQNKQTPFLYVRAPNKLRDTSLLPFEVGNDIIQNGDDLALEIANAGIDVLDLRQEMMNDNIDFSTAFYRADHHWTYPTGLWAFAKIGAFLNDKHGFEIDDSLWDENSYDAQIIDEKLVGSESVTSGIQIEEVRIDLFPKFEFEGTREYPSSTVIRYYNPKAQSSQRVLLFADSFGGYLTKYLSCAFEYVDYCSLYYYTDFYDFIEPKDYDMAIFMVSDVVVSYYNSPSFMEDRMYFGEPPR